MGELKPWMVKWLKREAQSSGSAGHKAREDTWGHIATAIEATLERTDREREALVRDAYVEGWKTGHGAGISCGHPLQSCPKDHDSGAEALDDWEFSDAKDAILTAQEGNDEG